MSKPDEYLVIPTDNHWLKKKMKWYHALPRYDFPLGLYMLYGFYGLRFSGIFGIIIIPLSVFYENSYWPTRCIFHEILIPTKLSRNDEIHWNRDRKIATTL